MSTSSGEVSSREGISPTRVLILGGSSEATALVAALSGRPDIAATVSLAGRTVAPTVHPIAVRVGGFGGVDGLVGTLRAERIDILVDATHPFAAQMSRNARAAARLAGCRLLDVTRPQWTPQAGDRWTEVATMADAASALGAMPRRVLLTIGRLQLASFAAAPWHAYVVRTIDPVEPGHGLGQAVFIEARGPFDVAGEERLMRNHRIDVLVTKNSGGAASAAKLDAARNLGLPVVMVRRPQNDGVAISVDEAVAQIVAHRGLAVRGV